LVQAQVASEVDGPSFSNIWTAMVTASHPAVFTLLTGQPVSTAPIVLDLAPVESAVVDNLRAQGNTTLDRALANVDLPPAVISLVPNSNVHAVRQAFGWLSDLKWGLPAITLVALVGALLLAPRRRRVVLGAAVGTGLVGVAIFGVFAVIRHAMVNDTHLGGTTTQASVAVFDTLTHRLQADLAILVVVSAAVAVAVVVSWVVPAGRNRWRLSLSRSPVTTGPS
jgi:hypothetical protein